MRIIKSIVYLCLALTLLGCATRPVTPPVTDDASIKLAEAAASISQSLTRLNAIEKAAFPVREKQLPYPTSYDMNQMVSIDWSGPIEPLLQRISGLCNYKLRVIGRRPAIPVLVTLSARDTPVGYIIRDANFQAGKKAVVAVYPAIRVIELRYARS